MPQSSASRQSNDFSISNSSSAEEKERLRLWLLGMQIYGDPCTQNAWWAWSTIMHVVDSEINAKVAQRLQGVHLRVQLLQQGPSILQQFPAKDGLRSCSAWRRFARDRYCIVIWLTQLSTTRHDKYTTRLTHMCTPYNMVNTSLQIHRFLRSLVVSKRLSCMWARIKVTTRKWMPTQ